MKVNVSRLLRKKNLIDLGHDVETTCDFGFMQPLMCRELDAQDTAMLRVGQAVQAQPMVSPTYGTINVRTYHSFVPAEDIYKPFPFMMSGQLYRGNSSYVPTEVPNVRLDILRMLPMLFGTIQVYDLDLTTNTEQTLESDTVTLNASPSTVFTLFLEDIDSTTDYSLGSLFNSSISLNYLSFDSTNSHSPSYYDLLDVWSDGASNYLICTKLSKAGRNLRKVLIGCGYQLSKSSTYVSLLPLFAYYKAYFDLFGIKRFTTWENTSAYALMQRYINDNLATTDICSTYYADLFAFLQLLCGAYYTQNPDYISSHITGTAIQESDGADSISFLSASNNVRSVTSSDDTNAELTVKDWSTIEALRRLTRRINLKTAFGGSVKNFMRSVFNSDVDEPESNYIGSTKTNLNITKVMNTAETSVGSLGEFAGQASGGSNGDHFKFTAKKFGYLVTICGIVPEARYVQGVDQTLRHIDSKSFYNPDFDGGWTLSPTPKNALYGTNSFVNHTVSSDFGDGFGNIPLYSECKVANNIINGDISLASTRESYLPFNVDKLLPYDYITYDDDSTEMNIVSLPTSVVTNGTIWRYIGMNKWLGNFNRIFVNSDNAQYGYLSSMNLFLDKTPVDDNFILFNYIDLKLSSYKLPLSDSFDTGAFDGDTMSVEKA